MIKQLTEAIEHERLYAKHLRHAELHARPAGLGNGLFSDRRTLRKMIRRAEERKWKKEKVLDSLLEKENRPGLENDMPLLDTAKVENGI